MPSGRPRKNPAETVHQPVMLTQEERRERRKQIAEDIRQGKKHTTVAREYGVSVATIANACQEHGVELKTGQLTQQERRERRKQIAADVAEGTDPQSVAKRHRVSIMTVANACKENNVTMTVRMPGVVPREKKILVQDKYMRIIAMLIAGDKTGEEIAAKLKISRQRVNQVKQRAEANGIFRAVEKAKKIAASGGK